MARVQVEQFQAGSFLVTEDFLSLHDIGIELHQKHGLAGPHLPAGAGALFFAN